MTYISFRYRLIIKKHYTITARQDFFIILFIKTIFVKKKTKKVYKSIVIYIVKCNIIADISKQKSKKAYSYSPNIGNYFVILENAF